MRTHRGMRTHRHMRTHKGSSEGGRTTRQEGSGQRYCKPSERLAGAVTPKLA